MSSSLISFSRRDIFETIPGLQCATYYLPKCEGKTPTILHVNDSHYYKPDIDGRNDMVFVPSVQIAESLVNMHITSQLCYTPDSHPAFFAIPGIEISIEALWENHKKQIEDILRKQKNWFIALVRMADDDWIISKRHNSVSDIQRTAAIELELSREWLLGVEDENKRLCPFCGSNLLHPDAPICPACGKVHNPAKYKELEDKFSKQLDGGKK